MIVLYVNGKVVIYYLSNFFADNILSKVKQSHNQQMVYKKFQLVPIVTFMLSFTYTHWTPADALVEKKNIYKIKTVTWGNPTNCG